MTESSILWGGITFGDHGPYTAGELATFISAIYQKNKATQGPLYGYLDGLEVVSNGVGHVLVKTGRAIIDGCGYSNTSALDIAIAVPAGADTHYFTVVLQKDFSAQTIRAVVLGPDLSAYPSVTQDTDVWEIEIARAIIAPGPAQSVTDTRVFSTLPMLLLSEAFIDEAVTADDIATNAINYEKLAAELYPYYALPLNADGEGEIACLSELPGTLDVIPTVGTDTYGYKLQSNGADAVPSFRVNVKACMKTNYSQFIPRDTDTIISLAVNTGIRTEDFDYGGFDTIVDKITIPVGEGGVYLVTASLVLGNVEYNTAKMTIMKNDVILVASEECLATGVGSAIMSVAYMDILVDADEISMHVIHNSTGGVTASDIVLSIMRLD